MVATWGGPPDVSADRHLSGTLDSTDGLAIFFQRWAPAGAARATLMISHGLAEHSGRYGNVIEHLVPLGYAVYALDHRGHGRSDGERCHVDRFDQFVDDLERFRQTVRSAQPTGPLILIGHSMGGAIALAYTIRHQQHLDGLVLSGPASTRGRSPSIFESARIEVLARLMPHRRLPPLPSSAISRDAAVVAAYDRDPLVTRNGPTVRLRRELRRVARNFPASMPGITLPVLIQHGEADELVSVEASVFLADRLGSESITLHTYPGLAHEVYNEPERGRVLEDLAGWLTSRW
ncbi:MAG: lysophospholipase [Actinobacteria bacterium]|nr:MAG: lysophospholipase [Actinomycetota bacterium]